MIFKRSTTRYGETPEPVTPYQKAAQLWDERIGCARVQARNWRLAAFGSLGLAILLSGGVIWQAGRSNIIPYVVEIDATGSARAVAPAVERYTPTDAQIAHHLARFVTNVRAISIDPIVVRQNWLDAYAYATDRAAATLNDYARDADPFAQVGKVSVSVDVTNVVRASEGSFEVRWIERRIRNGALEATTRFTGLFTIVVEPPRTEERLRANPLGIYVHGLDWSRDLITGD
ncbi:conjugal transfer protein TrbF [uncultured Erythrobacter sp.]|uniref:conjugal transfer protein TrbF n=1 Tax=uncultured Erythrobacter sp. TaxID=263913 RepID=UPI0026223CB6|nr:conjugal transfer protein TrbF [uncultured Erythrobacter sp.]